MASKTAAPSPARLSYTDGQVVVTPQDQDIFLISAEKATEACQRVVRTQDRVTNFREGLIQPMAKWFRQHADRIAASYMPIPDCPLLTVYVVGSAEAYDFDLSDDLSALSDDLAAGGWSVVFVLFARRAPDELSAFFNVDRSLQIYG